MTLKEIERLIRSAERSGLAECEVSRGGATLRLRSSAVEDLPNETAEPRSATHTSDTSITAPFVGRFRATHPASEHRYVEPGASIRRGQIVGFLQVGPVLRPVTAPRDGILEEALTEEGALVGFGTRLFTLV